VDREAVLWFEPGRAVCEQLGADPWGTLASGSLLGSFPAARVEYAQAELSARGFSVRSIAAAVDGDGAFGSDGQPLPRFERDEVARVLMSVGT
jgi:hydrogenase maturation factor